MKAHVTELMKLRVGELMRRGKVLSDRSHVVLHIQNDSAVIIRLKRPCD